MIEKEPLVSIILPTYNRADFLKEAISSVINQTYTNWELIIWDDGSIDETKAVVNYFKDERIHYFFENNQGMSYALNKALLLTKGEFIAFLDDDDQWKDNKLTYQVEIIRNNSNIDLLFGNFLNINLENNITGIGFLQNGKALSHLKVVNLSNDIKLINGCFLESMLISNFIAFDTVILRSNLKNHLKFNENLRNGMDLELWWRLGLRNFKFAYTEKIILKRIKPSGSLSSPGLSTFKNHIKALDLCKEEAIRLGREDLISKMNLSYRNSWNGILKFYVFEGEKNKLFSTFFKSIKYGINLRGVYLLIAGFLGKEFIRRIRGN